MMLDLERGLRQHTPDSRGLQRKAVGPSGVVLDDLDLVRRGRRLGAACEPSVKLIGSRCCIGRGRERRMKGDRGIREGVTKAGDLEMLSGVLSWCICRCDDEAETMVVPVIAEEDTPFGALRADCLKTRPDQLAANTPPLKSGLDRHRSEDKPPVLPRGTRLRERDMADDLLTKCSDERQGQGTGLAQCIDDERFRSVAERESGEGARSQRPDCVPVIDRLTTNDNTKITSVVHVGLQH